MVMSVTQESKGLMEQVINQFDQTGYVLFTPTVLKLSKPPEHNLRISKEFICKIGETTKKVNRKFLLLFSTALTKKYGKNKWHFAETVGVTENGKYKFNLLRGRVFDLGPDNAIVLASLSALRGPNIFKEKFSFLCQPNVLVEEKEKKSEIGSIDFKESRF